MDTNMVKEKMSMMLKKMWATPETIKAVEADPMSSSKPEEAPTASVTVVAVKKPEAMAMDYNITDEQIDKMSEQEAKDTLKKWRDIMNKEEKDEEKITPNPKPEQSIAERVMNTPNFK